MTAATPQTRRGTPADARSRLRGAHRRPTRRRGTFLETPGQLRFARDSLKSSCSNEPPRPHMKLVKTAQLAALSRTYASTSALSNRRRYRPSTSSSVKFCVG